MQIKRQELRLQFSIDNMKAVVEERNQLQQNHNNFLNCTYSPGMQFINTINQIKSTQTKLPFEKSG
jgi:hypothetical protein